MAPLSSPARRRGTKGLAPLSALEWVQAALGSSSSSNDDDGGDDDSESEPELLVVGTPVHTGPSLSPLAIPRRPVDTASMRGREVIDMTGEDERPKNGSVVIDTTMRDSEAADERGSRSTSSSSSSSSEDDDGGSGQPLPLWTRKRSRSESLEIRSEASLPRQDPSSISVPSASSVAHQSKPRTSSFEISVPRHSTAPRIADARAEKKHDRRVAELQRLWPPLSRFYRAILRWRYSISEDGEGELAADCALGGERALPASSSQPWKSKPSSALPSSFESASAYQLVYCPLLLRETLSTLQKESNALVDERRRGGSVAGDVAGRVEDAYLVDDGGSSAGGSLYMMVIRPEVRRRDTAGGSSPFSGGDLVAMQSKAWQHKRLHAALGVAQPWDPVFDQRASSRSRSSAADGDTLRVIVCVGNEGSGCLSHAELMSTLNGLPTVLMRPVGSIMTSSREYQALMSLPSLPHYILENLLRPANLRSSAPAALDPCPISIPKGVPGPLWLKLRSVFNSGQLSAIASIAEGTCGGISLLQGPPGTGKTRTILGILSILLAGACPHPQEAEYRHKAAGVARVSVGASLRPAPSKTGGASSPLVAAPVPILAPGRIRVLVCAPSNAAVDEIVVRLRTDGTWDSDGNSWRPTVVRVGAPAGGRAPSMGKFKGKGKRRRGSAGETLTQEYELEYLAEERKAREGGTLQHNRIQVLRGAQIVCATLSGCGSQPLIEACLLSVVGDSGGYVDAMKFDAVVMDEAAQATEPSCLIPLKFCPRSVVLVGDPQQLNATIFSQYGIDVQFDRSLFQRLAQCGHPVHLLDTQYRMHPAISQFPRAAFYGSRLLDGPNVLEPVYTKSFSKHRAFQPFVFMNLASGVTSSRANSLSNRSEAELVVNVFSTLMNVTKGALAGSVGIITPYAQQVGYWAGSFI
jgi:hypothetical protein